MGHTHHDVDSYELSPLVQCPLFAAVATLALALPAHAHGLAWGEEHLVRHVHAVLARRDQDKCKIIVQIACPGLEQQAGISIWGITQVDVFGHTMENAPYLVRSAKLSSIRPH